MKKRLAIIFFVQALLCQLGFAQFKIQQSSVPSVLYLRLKKADSVASCTINDPVIKGITACKSKYGDIYLTGLSFGNIIFKRSYDNGKTWHNVMKTVAKTKNAWNYKVHGLLTDGLPNIICDTLSGPNKDRIYISWGDEKYGKGNKDVFIAYSDDRGDNWTEPVLVTYRPNHKEQFKPAIALDQIKGTVYVSYFDQQNYIDTGYTDIYVAISNNGGLKFDYYKVNEKPIQINPKTSLENHLYIDTKGLVNLCWTATNEKSRPIYFNANITSSALNNYNKFFKNNEIRIERTFLFADTISVLFTSKHKLNMSAVISKPIEPGFEKVVFKSQFFKKGSSTLTINTKQLGLDKGNYILTLYYAGKNTYVWITE
jgi:hypothetical protein